MVNITSYFIFKNQYPPRIFSQFAVVFLLHQPVSQLLAIMGILYIFEQRESALKKSFKNIIK